MNSITSSRPFGWSLIAVIAFSLVLVLPHSAAASCDPLSGDECRYCVSDAEVDTYTKYPADSGHTLWLSIFAITLGAPDHEYEASGPSFFTEFPDGTAVLTASVVAMSDPSIGFDIVVNYSGATSTTMMPTRELADEAYSDFVPPGPVDPSTWHYYTSFVGTLTGTGGFAGGEIEISQLDPKMPFQVGFGANGKTATFGASGWFGYNVVSQPTDPTYTFPHPDPKYAGQHGDINIDLADCPAPTPDVRCADVDITENQFVLDGNAGLLRDLADRTARKLRRISGKPRAGARLLQEAEALYLESWGQVWSIPSVVTQCDNTSVCIHTDLTVTKAEFLANSEALGQVVESLLRKLKRTARQQGRRSGGVKRTKKRLEKLLSENEALVQTIPSFSSSCTTTTTTV